MAEAWKRLGDAIGSHMIFIVPCCVAAGVLAPDVFGPIERIVPYLFAFMTFQGALNNTLHQLIEVFRRPGKLIAILIVLLVAMPLAAFGLASLLFGGNPQIVCGITLEYCVPVGIVSFMWVGMFAGNGSLSLAAILVSTVISPFSIPATLSLLLGASVPMDPVGMMVNMAFMIALPAVAGMAVNDLTRGWGHERLSPAIGPLCRIFMVTVITANSTKMSDYILNLTWERASAALFILVFATLGFIVGIALARALSAAFPDLVTICFSCGLRNISSGAVIATQYFPGEAVFPVMCGTIFQQLLAALFGHVMERMTERERASQRKMVAAGRATSRRKA